MPTANQAPENQVKSTITDEEDLIDDEEEPEEVQKEISDEGDADETVEDSPKKQDVLLVRHGWAIMQCHQQGTGCTEICATLWLPRMQAHKC